MTRGFGRVIVTLFKLLMVIVASLAFLSLVFTIIGIFSSNFNAQKFVYILTAEFIFPIRIIIGTSLNSSITTISIIMSALTIILSITLAVLVSKLFYCGERRGGGSKLTIFSVGLAISLIYQLITIFIFSIKFNSLSIFLNTNSIPVSVSDTSNFNYLILKGIIVAGMLFIVSLLTLLATYISGQKGQKNLTFGNEMNFYSSEYDEVNVEKPLKNEENPIPVKVIEEKLTESNDDSRQLIKNIMKLNQMKDSGEITNKEYTKLREKEIRRYKK